jgi:hypothetical protein
VHNGRTGFEALECTALTEVAKVWPAENETCSGEAHRGLSLAATIHTHV